jgi:alpha-ketoglutarate-dependent taurine dioxygenase
MDRVMTTPGKRLGPIRRKAVDLASFNPIRESQMDPDQRLPVVMEPAADQVDLGEWVLNNRDYIAGKLHIHGGILFRGFHLKTPQDFERVVAAIYKEIYSEYGDLPREGAGGKIYTSTPYPEDKCIFYHNESSHMNRWPTRISFFCVTAAKEGGSSPIVDCRKVYQQLDPTVRDKFERLGLMYVRNFSDGLDVSWQHFFQTEDRAAVEDACQKQGFIAEWVGQDNLRVKQCCRAVRRHPVTGELSFFNQVQLHHVHCLDPAVRESVLSIFKREDLPRHVYYGDGSEIGDSEMDHVGEIYEKNAVRFTWREGDMVTLDNMLTAHGRDSFVGPRKILVALGDLVAGVEVDRINAAYHK